MVLASNGQHITNIIQNMLHSFKSMNFKYPVKADNEILCNELNYFIVSFKVV